MTYIKELREKFNSTIDLVFEVQEKIDFLKVRDGDPNKIDSLKATKKELSRKCRDLDQHISNLCDRPEFQPIIK